MVSRELSIVYEQQANAIHVRRERHIELSLDSRQVR